MAAKFTQSKINIRDIANKVQRKTGVAGEALLRSESVSEQQKLLGVGRKNLIINGDMKIAQRGTSGTVSGDGYGRYLSVDRWSAYYDGTTLSQENAEVNGQKKKALKVDAGTGGGRPYVYQKIENGSAILGGGQKFSLSFWAKSPTGAILDINYRYYEHANENAPSNGTLVYRTNLRLDSEWRYYKFEGLSAKDAAWNDTRDFGLWFQPEDVSANDGRDEEFWITDVQLELGPVATPFEHRSYGEELALCQRYFQVYDTLGSGVWNSTTSFFCSTSLPVAMRVVPTITMNSGTYSNINIEHVDTYDVTNVYPGHASSAGEKDPWEVSTFISILDVTSARTVGDAGVVVCDQNNDFFRLDAEL